VLQLVLLATGTTRTNPPRTTTTPRDLVERYRNVYTTLEPPAARRDLTATSTVERNERQHPQREQQEVHHASPTFRFSRHATLNAAAASDDNNHPNNAAANNKPVAIYLPGLDGYGISAAAQFDDLAQTFDLWRLTIDATDRSSFTEAVTAIANFVGSFGSSSKEQPPHVTLIGESCGGLLAAAVAIQLSQASKEQPLLQGLVLVNPATSFEETLWDRAVPLLTNLVPSSAGRETGGDDTTTTEGGPSPYAILGSLLLASIVPDAQQTRRIVDTFRETLPDLSSSLLSSANDDDTLQQILRDSFQTTEDRLPPALLEHRVTQWLTVGAAAVTDARLVTALADLPTLIVAGEQDRLLPSRREADRLARLLPHAEKLVVPDRGHLVLDDSVNATEAILYSKIDPLRWRQQEKPYDPITDWKLPAAPVVQEYIDQAVRGLRDAFSPVFFSTDANGKRWRGLGRVPSSSSSSAAAQPRRPPLLFVGNHQFAALDLQFLVAELWEQRGIFVRGLAHPVTFMQQSSGLNFRNDLGGRTPGLVAQTSEKDGNGINNNNNLFGGFEKFGAVMVTPRNYYRLMQTGQDALLFPGGAKEALNGDKSYPLFWPEKVDFVRTAARFNATIVPVSAVGMVDSVNVLAEPQELLNLPFVGERLRRQQANVTAARYDQKPQDETVGFPLAVPSLPKRNYVLFGKPIDTTSIDPSDRQACKRIYEESQQEVRRGIDDLLQAREQDPFKETPRRFVYERLWGKQAPSFPVSALNNKKHPNNK